MPCPPVPSDARALDTQALRHPGARYPGARTGTVPGRARAGRAGGSARTHPIRTAGRRSSGRAARKAVGPAARRADDHRGGDLVLRDARIRRDPARGDAGSPVPRPWPDRATSAGLRRRPVHRRARGRCVRVLRRNPAGPRRRPVGHRALSDSASTIGAVSTRSGSPSSHPDGAGGPSSAASRGAHAARVSPLPDAWAPMRRAALTFAPASRVKCG